MCLWRTRWCLISPHQIKTTSFSSNVWDESKWTILSLSLYFSSVSPSVCRYWFLCCYYCISVIPLKQHSVKQQISLNDASRFKTSNRRASRKWPLVINGKMDMHYSMALECSTARSNMSAVLVCCLHQAPYRDKIIDQFISQISFCYNWRAVLLLLCLSLLTTP